MKCTWYLHPFNSIPFFFTSGYLLRTPDNSNGFDFPWRIELSGNDYNGNDDNHDDNNKTHTKHTHFLPINQKIYRNPGLFEIQQNFKINLNSLLLSFSTGFLCNVVAVYIYIPLMTWRKGGFFAYKSNCRVKQSIHDGFQTCLCLHDIMAAFKLHSNRPSWRI